MAFARTWNKIIFNGYAPLESKPLTVYCYVPARGEPSSMKILFLMHGFRGGDRNEFALVFWTRFAEDAGLILVAPCFPPGEFSSAEYQMGNVSSLSDGFEPVSPDRWTFHYIEPLFDQIQQELSSTEPGYYMYGHASGGQFVHRFLLAVPQCRVIAAVAANTGMWTFPVADGRITPLGEPHPWPWTVMGTPFASDEYLRPFFLRNFSILVGEAATRAFLPKDYTDPEMAFMVHPNAMEEGENRLERGANFFRQAKTFAMRKNMRFNWRFASVPNVANQTSAMFIGDARSPDPALPYSTQTTKLGAFRHLFGDL